MTRRVVVTRNDCSPEESWHLLNWCMRRGADEFGLEFLGPPYLPRTEWAAVDELLAPFRRRVASAGDRWCLTAESAAVLRDVLGASLLGDPAGAPPPVGDLTVYRGGEPLLRVTTADGEATLHIRDDEATSLERAGIRYHQRRP